MPTPEAKARQNIDALLEAAGWVVQDRFATLPDHDLLTIEIVEDIQAAFEQIVEISDD